MLSGNKYCPNQITHSYTRWINEKKNHRVIICLWINFAFTLSPQIFQASSLSLSGQLFPHFWKVYGTIVGVFLCDRHIFVFENGKMIKSDDWVIFLRLWKINISNERSLLLSSMEFEEQFSDFFFKSGGSKP